VVAATSESGGGYRPLICDASHFSITIVVSISFYTFTSAISKDLTSWDPKKLLYVE
jgi:hypothetical protein